MADVSESKPRLFKSSGEGVEFTLPLRVLMVSPLFPWPATNGGMVRIAEIVRGLARFSRITFVAPVDGPPAEYQQYIPADLGARVLLGEIQSSTTRRLCGILSVHPYHCAVYASPSMQDLVSQQLEENEYDLVYCHFIYSLQYLPDVVHIPIILDQQNVDRHYWERKAMVSKGVKRLVSLWNLWKVKRYESVQLDRLWAYVSVSQEDCELTSAYARPFVKNFFVAPNGVDVQFHTPIDWTQRCATREVKLVFLGSFDMDFNATAAEHLCLNLLPRIRAALPESAFRVILLGRDPPRRLIALAKEDKSITVTGTVKDVRPWLHQADIFVAPLRAGAGTKLKVVEAMASALPVVGSDIALQGLGGENGVHYWRANNDLAFVQAICDLRWTPSLGQR